MKTFIHEMGVIDKTGRVHPVRFKEGLNVVTGKSSTGKSALIEIFDYCFGSSEYTVPEGDITNNADIYYLYLSINDQTHVFARSAEETSRAFFNVEPEYNPDKISRAYFDRKPFIDIENFKKYINTLFLSVGNVETSLVAQQYREQKASSPTVRNTVSFLLQHQNLVANKHALFYRFDDNRKAGQVMDHTKIFLGLVDQNYFFLKQEEEQLELQEKALKREQKAHENARERQKSQIEPILRQLYAEMGLDTEPVSIDRVLNQPAEARKILNEVI